MVRELVPVVSSEAGWKKPSAQTVAPASWAKLPEGPKHVLTMVHISDTHVCDAQSPARLPFTNRYGDRHFLEKPFVEGPVGNYRPQELLTSQVLRQMISTINHIKGPVSGRGVDLTVITGDLTDNAQENEFSWVRNLLVGGRVSPNSGSKSEFEGPGGNLFDPYYWNPDEQNESDFPKDLFGFPTIPELTMAAINSFSSPGLEMPFLAVHGNHDELLQGTVAPEPWLNELATLEKRPTNLIQDSLFHEVVSKFSPVGPACWPTPEMLNQVSTTADPDRLFVTHSSWQEQFGKPKYFSSWHAGFLFISLNTVNPHGGWDGSLDPTQLQWLEALLNENPQTPVILLSHHPLSTLNNGWAPLGSDSRVTGEQFESFLSNFSNIVAWFAGHEHRNSVTRVCGENGFWLIETCSLIDWPQEGRIAEFFIKDEDLLISLSMFQHDSPDSVIADQALIENIKLEDIGTLASISRELSANDWQRQSGESSIHNLRGSDRDRTVVLQHPMRGLRL